MYYVYILTSENDKAMYIGVTGDLQRRIAEHKKREFDGFTKKYHIHKLVYYEEYSSPQDAIKREKQIKKWNRGKKNLLIDKINPLRKDIYKYSP